MFRSMRIKILTAMITITALATCCISILFYWRSSSMIEKNYSENLYARAKQIGDSFDQSMQEMYYISAQASCDFTFLDKINKYRSNPSENNSKEILEVLREYSKRSKDLSSVYLILTDVNSIFSSKEYPVFEEGREDSEMELIKKSAKCSMKPILLRDPLKSSGYLISFISKITDENGDEVAYIMMNMDERSIYYKYLANLEEDKIVQALILDSSSSIVSIKNTERIMKEFEEENAQVNQSSIRAIYRGVFSEYYFLIEADREIVLEDLGQIKRFQIIILTIAFVIALILAVLIARAMYNPIKQLKNTMEEVSNGDLEKRVQITSKDEIGVLSESFNRMLEHIKDLIEQLIQQEMLKKDAELEALQYQITPHFMYNTLNSIKYAALLKGEEEIGGLIEDFVELLQASINKKGTFVMLAEELHFVRNYMELQGMRYENKIHIEYQIQEQANSCFLPRLILQPLVENAILYGVDLKKKENQIDIGAEIRGEILYLWVRDQGRGMSEEQIQRLLNENPKKKHGLSGIGVYNVKERLELYYGDLAGIYYSSSSKGTKVEICLPAYKEQEKYGVERRMV